MTSELQQNLGRAAQERSEPESWDLCGDLLLVLNGRKDGPPAQEVIQQLAHFAIEDAETVAEYVYSGLDIFSRLNVPPNLRGEVVTALKAIEAALPEKETAFKGIAATNNRHAKRILAIGKEPG